MYSSRKKKDRVYSIRKTSIKDDLIDKQILAIHRAMVEKVLATPELIDDLKQRLKDKRDNGEISYSEFITWYSVMELSDEPEVFRSGVLEDSKQMRRLRRKTPFVGILSEDERQQAIEKGAAGYIDSVDYMFN